MIEKDFGLNWPQAQALLVNANKNYIVWARGTGKTTGVLGPKSLDLVHKMPRAKGGFIGKDYEQIFERTLPECTAVWEQLGYFKERHWRIGKPLEWWEQPLIPPLKWDNVVSWYNGSAIHLFSLAVKGCANGVSVQWVMGDEMKFWKQHLLKEVLKAVRGLHKEFGHLPEYLCHWFSTDKWVDDIADIQWILDYRKKHDSRAVDIALSLQIAINDLQIGYNDKTEEERHLIDEEVREIEDILTPLRKTLVNFTEASAEENTVFLGDQYLPAQQEELTEDEFNIAIKNQDPKRSRGAFYPALKDDIHWYESDHDVDPTAPLILAGDYQASISPLCIAQYTKLPGQSFSTLNFVRSVYTLHPKGLIDAINEFIELFKHHQDKLLYYIYDHTAIGRNAFLKTYSELVVETLQAAGWAVMEVYTWKAPDHGIKYECIKKYHSNTDPAVAPLIRFNKKYNESLKISMERARGIQSGKDTKKDKQHEDTHRYPDYPQNYSTHFSDVHDQIVWATHELQVVPMIQQGSSFSSATR